MSRSSEEVLLIVKHVKNKKCEGTLYMMGTRMAWMQPSKDTFTVSHSYADIKVQKISPDTKDKVQLQIVLHDGGANTFHFAHPEGRTAQQSDREGVKDLLQQLIPKFRRKVNSELEEKNRMLQDDPELFHLYKNLVVSGVITAEEFWANRANKKLSNNHISQQDVGVSAAFLADIKPQTDGCNGLRYNLTSDIIESIFRTYPAVRKKHAENVPDKLTEQEFWTRFFQSHYFHRDRINFSKKDLFAECAKTDEQDIQRELEKPLTDPMVDLNLMSDQTTGEGYGTMMDDVEASINPANASLLRRFNQHSTMVLKACDTSRLQPDGHVDDGHTSQLTNGHQPVAVTNNAAGSTGASQHGTNPQGEPPPNKKARLREKIEYEDLDPPDTSSSGPALRLTRLDGYLHGPTPVTAMQYTTSEEGVQACQAVTQEMLAWQSSLTAVLPSNSAGTVLWEMSPGGALMQGHSNQQLDQLVPTDLQQELKHLYTALCELLRHFWTCFPTSSKALEDKVVRMRTNLEKFQMAKMNPLKEKIRSFHYNLNLTGHMDEMLDAAYTKFNTWQSKRMTRRS